MRAAWVVAVVLAAALAAWRLARVDTALGAPTGPDRLVAQQDAADESPASVQQVAVAVLRDRPVEGAAFRWLGANADARGDGLLAARHYGTAIRLDPRDTVTRRWLLERALESGDMPRMAVHLDALLRTSPETGESVLRRVLAMLDNSSVREAIAGRLARDPPWRHRLAPLLASTPYAAPSEALLAAMSSQGLRPDELAVRVSLLEALGRPGKARAVWSAGLPDREKQFDGSIFDAGFELGAGPEPYGWRLPSSPEVLVGLDSTQAAQGRSSLLLVLQDRAVQFSGVSQELVLPPGSYRWQVQADISLAGNGRPFAWVLSCRGSSTEIVRLSLPKRTAGWQEFSLPLDIPANCPMQSLKLIHEGRSLAERMLSGRLRFDAMTLIRARE